MNIKLFRDIKSLLLIAIITGAVASCNKPFPDGVPIPYPDANNSSVTLGTVISTDTTYSIFKAAAIRVGILPTLMDSSKIFTVFLPNNAAFRASGIASEAVIGVLPITSVGAIVNYHIVPGEQFLSSSIPTDFPNIQLPTALTIGVLPGTSVPLKMTIFPSKRANGTWVNTIPIVSPDNKYRNGVIHVMAAIVNPPSQVLKDAMYSNPNLKYFKAAIARADSGANGLSKLDSLLGYGVTNMTVLAPNDAAFQTLIYGTVYAYVLGLTNDPATAATQAAALSSSPTVFSNPALYGVLTAATVKGILAYHFLATNQGLGYQPNIRVLSNNFATTPGVFYTTLVNTSIPASLQPGVMAQAAFTGPFVSTLTFKGAGTFPPGGAPYSQTATAVSKDNIAVNGVFYIIDKVLLPQ